MQEKKYKTHRIVDGKVKWVIIDKDGNIINKNPNNESLKSLGIEPRKVYDTRKKIYTKEALLNYLSDFPKKYGKIPVIKDFDNNPERPSFMTYVKRFGSWQNALKLVGLDTESRVVNGVLENSDQKSRFTEIIVKNHFKKNPVDLAGENKLSPYDGICPNGMIYDVKSSKLYEDEYWIFAIRNKSKEKIEIYYLLAFNEDYTELMRVWRIPGLIVIERNCLQIGLLPTYKFNAASMKEYEITDKINFDIKKRESDEKYIRC